MLGARSKSGAISVHRRTLLRMAMAGAAGIWGGRLTPPVRGERTAEQSVVVLGGGLSGLIAAYELSRCGHDVVVLETQHRAGGRVFTSYDGFLQGQYAEWGATRIPSGHDLTLHYAHEFGLTLDVFPPSRANYLMAGNVFLQPSQGEPWPLDLTPQEQVLGPTYPAARLSETSPAWSHADAPGWPPPNLARQYDPLTMVSWLKSIGAGRDMISLYTTSSGNYVGIGGALQLGAQEVMLEGTRSLSHIRGGNENLPRSIAAALGPRMRYGTSVTSIKQNQNSVTVYACNDDGPLSFQADHVISALPPTILSTIPIRPALPALTARAIAQYKLSGAFKTAIQTRSRFWNENGMTGLIIAATDTPAQRAWDVSSVQPGSFGMLNQYCNDSEPAFAGTTAAQRRCMITEFLAPVLPQLENPGEILRWKEFQWKEQPWVRGGISFIRPDQAWMLKVLPVPVGRLHFAGDHTTIWGGWMQGAIQSGLRAAQEIDGSIGYEMAA